MTWDLVSPDLPLTTLPRMTVLTQSEMTSALCNGSVDAGFFVVAHPSELISNRLAACQSNFVGLRAPIVDKLVSKYPFYTRRFIPTDLYHIPDAVLTFGPVATLVTSASSDPRMVAAIAKAIVTHIAELKMMHPVLAELDAEQMVAQTLTALVPLHPAAAAIYEKQGLIK
jgi:TRAP transporter TAXI family solute receptor